MTALKQAVLRAATAPAIARLARRLMSRHATIFMLHRFHDPVIGSEGIDPAIVRRGLARLRADGFELIGLMTLYERLVSGEPLNAAVAFTIDDGYRDHAEVAAPLFAEFDCPVTTFLCTGFLDRRLWFWWDRVAYVFQATKRSAVQVRLGSHALDYRWSNPPQRRGCQLDFVERCKQVADDEKHAAIARLAEAAGVTVPDAPPPGMEPMTWDQARACEARGMSFGPHTVTHPILSRTGNEQCRAELGESWRRLQAELSDPVPVFCYPNGGPDDFGTREITMLGELGLAGAVVGTPGYAGLVRFRSDTDQPFRVRRFAFPPSLPRMVQYASGIERFKQIVRREEA